MAQLVLAGDSLEVLKQLPENSVDSVVTDPPYGLGREPGPEELTRIVRAWALGEHVPVTGRGFMGRSWDAFVPGSAIWCEVFRVLKPGGHVLAFAGSRTVDLMGLSLRLAGFEIRDQLQWLYGSGFPKSLDVSKALDAAAGAEREVVGMRPNPDGYARNKPRTTTTGSMGAPNDAPGSAEVTAPATPEAAQWNGWGTALKPAHEPIVLARKPLAGTVAANVLEHGTGAINVDGCRIEGCESAARVSGVNAGVYGADDRAGMIRGGSPLGRWPANVILDEDAGAVLDAQSGERPPRAPCVIRPTGAPRVAMGALAPQEFTTLADAGGGASRFFYCPKASRAERDAGVSAQPCTGGEATGRIDGTAGLQSPRAGAGRTGGARNTHPTVKPIDLMRWLVRLITPPGGLVLDPFTGSGTTGAAAALEGFEFLGIELDAEHATLARERIAYWAARADQG